MALSTLKCNQIAAALLLQLGKCLSIQCTYLHSHRNHTLQLVTWWWQA